MRIGVDLGGTKIEVAALDAAGHFVLRRRVPTPSGEFGTVVRAIAELVRAAETELGSACSVGVGHPGTTVVRTGLIKNANSATLNDQPLRAALSTALGREVRTANDADCFALSEAVDGAGAGARTVFGVILGTGVGGGVVVDQRLLDGPNGIAGEWGHNGLPWPTADEVPGPACYCGGSGCIESFLSGPALRRHHHAAGGADVEGQEIVARAGAGDEIAECAMAIYASRLARALASVVNLLDPHVIVLGGGLSDVERLYVDVPAIWGRWVFSDTIETRLVAPLHGGSSGVRGAAWLWPPKSGDAEAA
jgi:fructokinase